MLVSRARREQVKKSLRFSILDGTAFSMMAGFTQDYTIPFALALKATAYQVSLLSSIPSLAMSMVQLMAPQLTKRAGSRKGLILPSVLLQALLWLPILLIPFFFPGNQIWWLIGLITLSTVFGSIGNPAWGSLMADLVPEDKRGKYFGLRGRICTLITLVFFFAGGAILQYSTANIFLGFAILFGSAIFFRLVSWYFLSRMYEPPVPQKQEQYNLLALIKGIGSSNTGRFIIFIALICFATGISNPFFAVYMLRDLKFDYLTFVAVSGTATLSTLVFLPFWGKRADTAGNIKVIRFTALIIPLVPILWLGSHHIYYLIPIQILSGFGWAGFNLVATNFLYDASEGTDRTHIIALSNAMNGVGACLGALTGGLLISRIPAIFGYHELTIFTLSGVLRGIIVLIMIKHIAEVRHVPEIHTRELLFGKNHGHSNGIHRLPSASATRRPVAPQPALSQPVASSQAPVTKREIIRERSSISLR